MKASRLGLVVPIMLVLAMTDVVHANMAKWWSEGELHGPLVPQEDTLVRVDAEDLSFVIAPSLETAEVTATYRMTNGGATDSKSEVAFVMVASENAKHGSPSAPTAPRAIVTIDGQPVTGRVVTEADVPADELETVRRGWTKRPDSGSLAWVTFPLAIGAGATRTVRVQYTHIAGSDRRMAVNDVFTYAYLLSPAKRWARFGELHIDVQVPPETELRGSSIPFVPGAKGAIYRATLPGLPPGELDFGVMSRRGLLFGMSQPTGYWLVLLGLLALVGIPASARLGRFWARASSRPKLALGCIFGTGAAAFVWNGLVIAALSAVLPSRAFGNSYAAMAGFVVLIPFSVIVAIAISFAATRARTPKAATPDGERGFRG